MSTGRPRMISPVGRITFPFLTKPLNIESRPMNVLEALTKAIEFADRLSRKHPGIVRDLLEVTRRHGRAEAQRIVDSVVGYQAPNPADIPFENWPDIGVALARKLNAEIDEARRVAEKAAVPAASSMCVLGLQMLLHFHTTVGPFTPEATRRSDAYVANVKYLLRQKLIERIPDDLREKHGGWAYKTTERGVVFVKALEALPLPVAKNETVTTWVMPS